MKKTLLMSILAMGCIGYTYAQTDNLPAADANAKTEKTFEHSIGFQMNPLIRQVLNFNNSTTTANVSPYLGTYNINYKKTGWGLRTGVGYNYSETKTGDGTPTTNDSKISVLQFRLGIEKAFKLSEKWSAGAGLDFVYNANSDNTTAVVHASDTITTVTKDVISSVGGGPMAWLRYSLTSKILIGTETSFYYLTVKEKNEVDVTSSDPFFGNNSSTKTNNKVNSGTFTVPVAFYLIIKF